MHRGSLQLRGNLIPTPETAPYTDMHIGKRKGTRNVTNIEGAP